jgi:hypothetical protein
MKKTQVVMTADLARYLISKGFPIIDLDKHRSNPTATVFIFDYTKELQNAMDIYFEASKLAKPHSA